MGVGILLGKLAPDLIQGLRGLEFRKGSQINVPIAVLIWLMITPMMMKVDFSSVRNVGRRPAGLLVTLLVNWVVKPFSMTELSARIRAVLRRIRPGLADDQISQGDNSYALQLNTTKVLGSHEIKAGGEFRVIQHNNQQTGAGSPTFSFATNWTQGPNPSASSATAGSSVAWASAASASAAASAGTVLDRLNTGPPLYVKYSLCWLLAT